MVGTSDSRTVLDGGRADPLAVRRRFDKPLPATGRAPLYLLAAERLLQRLELMVIAPDVVLDLGCGQGEDLSVLRQRYPKAFVIGLDQSLLRLGTAARSSGLASKSGAMLRQLRKALRSEGGGVSLCAAAAEALPLKDHSIDLLVSNQLLPWCAEPERVFAEMYRVLAPGGALLFSAVGPDTAKEYQSIWSGVDRYSHTFGLYDMHDLGDMMAAAGFQAPVVDRTNLTLEYASVSSFESDLRHSGLGCVALGRRRGLLSTIKAGKVSSTPLSQTNFTVTLELLHGHAWKPMSSPPGGERQADGVHVVSLDNLRRGLKQQR